MKLLSVGISDQNLLGRAQATMQNLNKAKAERVAQFKGVMIKAADATDIKNFGAALLELADIGFWEGGKWREGKQPGKVFSQDLVEYFLNNFAGGFQEFLRAEDVANNNTENAEFIAQVLDVAVAKARMKPEQWAAAQPAPQAQAGVGGADAKDEPNAAQAQTQQKVAALNAVLAKVNTALDPNGKALRLSDISENLDTLGLRGEVEAIPSIFKPGSLFAFYDTFARVINLAVTKIPDAEKPANLQTILELLNNGKAGKLNSVKSAIAEVVAADSPQAFNAALLKLNNICFWEINTKLPLALMDKFSDFAPKLKGFLEAEMPRDEEFITSVGTAIAKLPEARSAQELAQQAAAQQAQREHELAQQQQQQEEEARRQREDANRQPPPPPSPPPADNDAAAQAQDLTAEFSKKATEWVGEWRKRNILLDDELPADQQPDLVARIGERAQVLFAAALQERGGQLDGGEEENLTKGNALNQAFFDAMPPAAVERFNTYQQARRLGEKVQAAWGKDQPQGAPLAEDKVQEIVRRAQALLLANDDEVKAEDPSHLEARETRAVGTAFAEFKAQPAKEPEKPADAAIPPKAQPKGKVVGGPSIESQNRARAQLRDPLQRKLNALGDETPENKLERDEVLARLAQPGLADLPLEPPVVGYLQKDHWKIGWRLLVLGGGLLLGGGLAVAWSYFAFPLAMAQVAAVLGLTGPLALIVPLLGVGLIGALFGAALLAFLEARLVGVDSKNYIFIRNLVIASGLIAGVALGLFIVTGTPAVFSLLSLAAGATSPLAYALPFIFGGLISLTLTALVGYALYRASGMRENQWHYNVNEAKLNLMLEKAEADLNRQKPLKASVIDEEKARLLPAEPKNAASLTTRRVLDLLQQGLKRGYPAKDLLVLFNPIAQLNPSDDRDALKSALEGMDANKSSKEVYRSNSRAHALENVARWKSDLFPAGKSAGLFSGSRSGYTRLPDIRQPGVDPLKPSAPDGRRGSVVPGGGDSGTGGKAPSRKPSGAAK